MMNFFKLWALMSVLSLLACSPAIPTFLQGEWHAINGNVVEVWELVSDERMSGFSYKETRDNVLETLEIVREDGEISYRATVPTQNDGKTIPFKLVSKKGKQRVFENPQHDFPKKLIYEMIDPDTLHVMVLGANEQGFEVFYVKGD